MIYLESTLFDKRIDATDGGLFTCVIENKKLFYAVLRYCYLDFKGEDNYFRAFDQRTDEQLPMSFLGNLYDLDINCKKNLNALYRTLKAYGVDGIQEQMERINEELAKVVQEIRFDFDAPLVMGDKIKVDDVLKLVNLRFEELDDGLLESLIRYIRAMHTLNKVSFFVSVHLHDYLEGDELNELLNELRYQHIFLVDIESNLPVTTIADEAFVIIDRDLCTVY